MRKSKIANVLLIAALMLSIINISVPVIQSLGGQKNVALSFFVTAQSKPNVVLLNHAYGGNQVGTTVTAVYQNLENFDVHGTVTATLKTSQAAEPLVKTSDRITIAANQYATVTITFNGVPNQAGYASFVTFTAEETVSASPTYTGSTTTGTTNNFGTTRNSTTGGFDYASLTLPISAVMIVVLCAVGGVVVLKKRGISEQKVKRFTSYEFQDWVLKRLQAHAGSVLDSRKGIDGFTGENVPVSIKQSDSVERFQVDIFMNTLMQAKVRSGIMVAFGFSSEANAAVSRARMNRIDIKLVTVKELIERKEIAII